MGIETELNYENHISSFYDIRITFFRDLHRVTVFLRLTKNGRPKKKNFEIIPEIEEFIPFWIRYGGKAISVYHRTNQGKYVNTTKRVFKQIDNRGGVEPPEIFKQQIEGLVHKTYEHYFSKQN